MRRPEGFRCMKHADQPAFQKMKTDPGGLFGDDEPAPIHCPSSSTFTPSPHSRHLNASIRLKPGNRFTAPHFEQISLATSSESSISSRVRRISATGTVRNTASHSLQTIST